MGRVCASTQNQALCALLFLCHGVLRVDLPYVEGMERAKCSARVPVVATRQEVESLLCLPASSLTVGRIRQVLMRAADHALQEAAPEPAERFDDSRVELRAGAPA
jgi:hypothetical protein